MASIFSTYNLSGQMDAFKRSLDSDDMEEISDLLGVEDDNTIIVLYQRGEFSQRLTEDTSASSLDIQTTRIRNNSVF